MRSLNILCRTLLVITLLLDRWQHHSLFYSARDWHARVLVVEGEMPKCIKEHLPRLYGGATGYMSTLWQWVTWIKEAETGGVVALALQSCLTTPTTFMKPLQNTWIQLYPILWSRQCDDKYWRAWLFQGLWSLGVINADQCTQTDKAIASDLLQQYDSGSVDFL
jgi:hypothetical protein